MKITYEEATRVPYEEPDGAKVSALRMAQRVAGRVMSQTEFGAILHVSARQVMRWEQNGMSAIEWFLVRITFDPVLREHWGKDVLRYVSKLERREAAERR